MKWYGMFSLTKSNMWKIGFCFLYQMDWKPAIFFSYMNFLVIVLYFLVHLILVRIKNKHVKFRLFASSCTWKSNAFRVVVMYMGMYGWFPFTDILDNFFSLIFDLNNGYVSLISIFNLRMSLKFTKDLDFPSG